MGPKGRIHMSSITAGLRSFAHDFGQLSVAQKALRIGGATLGVSAVGVGVAACSSAPPPRTGADAAKAYFGQFDKDPKDDRLSRDEVKVPWRSSLKESTEVNAVREGNIITHEIMDYHTIGNSSVEKIFNAAKGSDAYASWKEIGDVVVAQFDGSDGRKKDGLLSEKERSNMMVEYGSRMVDLSYEEVGRRSWKETVPIEVRVVR
jgi:hypothetical protein